MSEQISVGICETQPLTAQGLEAVLRENAGYSYAGAVHSLGEAAAFLARTSPSIFFLDKSFGVQSALEWVAEHRAVPPATAIVVWGLSITEAEALRFLQIGAKGIIRKTATRETLLCCLEAVAKGSSWMEDSLFRESARQEKCHRSELTPREQQVMELVEQGFKNKEIAHQLGIRPGTVKIHLKHIFEKTGVRGRYGLALSGMKDKGLLALP
ncbi:MAG TPA: response regulator transcription factor [Bryobacteraceae bacterium]|nr:response regulator transcription factor [Bryobacteraceae bacterium]